MGKDIWLVDHDNITKIMIVSHNQSLPSPYQTNAVQYFFANMLIYCTSRFLIRASIILFYIRVFPYTPERGRLGCILKMTFDVNFIYNLSFFLAVLFQYTPVHFFWEH